MTAELTVHTLRVADCRMGVDLIVSLRNHTIGHEREKMWSKAKGFTLIELMITVAIVAILAAIALPSYQQYVIRGNRAAAQQFMMQIASREEQYLLDARQYADTVATLSLTAPSEISGKYTFAITVANGATPPTFSITATAAGNQAVDGNLTLDSTGAKTPADKWK